MQSGGHWHIRKSMLEVKLYFLFLMDEKDRWNTNSFIKLRSLAREKWKYFISSRIFRVLYWKPKNKQAYVSRILKENHERRIFKIDILLKSSCEPHVLLFSVLDVYIYIPEISWSLNRYIDWHSYVYTYIWMSIHLSVHTSRNFWNERLSFFSYSGVICRQSGITWPDGRIVGNEEKKVGNIPLFWSKPKIYKYILHPTGHTGGTVPFKIKAIHLHHRRASQPSEGLWGERRRYYHIFTTIISLM